MLSLALCSNVPTSSIRKRIWNNPTDGSPHEIASLFSREQSKSSLSSDSVSSSFNTNSNNEHQHIVYVKSNNHILEEDEGEEEKEKGYIGQDNSVDDRSSNPYLPPPLDDSRAEKRSIVGG